jgi:hypothetical protein
MEREVWLRFYRMLTAYAHRAGAARPRGCSISDVVIASVHMWAVIHDRPESWACVEANWPGPKDWRPFSRLPSQSCLSRRVRRESLKRLLDGFARHVAEDVFGASDTLVKRVDSKPLPVGTYSRCKDARWGEATKIKMRGYKLFCVYGNGPMPIAHEVSSMNASDARVGRRLVGRLEGSGYVLGDSGFDANKFYAACAEANHQGVTRRKRPNTGFKTGAEHHPHRLRAVELLEGERDGKGGGAFGLELYKLRTGIERDFGQLTNIGGGLSGLPNWVRWLPRVRRWVRGKLLAIALRHVPKTRSYRAAA